MTQKREDPREIFYVGTFGQSIYTLALNVAAPSLTLLNETQSPRCPDVFAIDSAKAVLYVGIENSGGHGGVSAFDISNPLDMRGMSYIQSRTAGPCHIALVRERMESYLVGSGYFDGRVQAFALNGDGSIRKMCSDLALTGSGPYHHPNYISKQDQARMHCMVPIPGTECFASADLGGDAIYVFRLVDGQIREVNRKKLRSGSGPRHIAVSVK